MNKELMLDRDFIRCSVVVAELLIKYKSKEELNNSEESDKDSDIHIFYIDFVFGIAFSFIIVYNRQYRCVLLIK